MHYVCSQCNEDAIYSEGPLHSYKIECSHCGHLEQGTFSPKIKRDPKLEKEVNCEICLSSIADLTHLKKIVPQLNDIPTSKLIKTLTSANLCWNIGVIPMNEVLRYEQLCEKTPSIKIVVK